MSAIGIFIIGHFVSRVLAPSKSRGRPIWRRTVAAVRYLSYRGFHVRSLGWNSASIGVLLLGAAGTLFFFCKLPINRSFRSKTRGTTDFCLRQAWISSHRHTTGRAWTGVDHHRWRLDPGGCHWHACPLYCKQLPCPSASMLLLTLGKRYGEQDELDHPADRRHP